MLRRLIARRVERDEQSRLDLFELSDRELPIETLRCIAIAMQPRLDNGEPAALETMSWLANDAGVESKLLSHGYGFTPVTFDSVLLLTNRNLWWRPIRAYRGKVPQPNKWVERPLPAIRSTTRPIYRFAHNPPYLPYPLEMLGPRAIPIDQIAEVFVAHQSDGTLRAYPTMILIVQKEGTSRVYPWWPSFDLEPFVTRSEPEGQFSDVHTRIEQRLRSMGLHVNPVGPAWGQSQPKYEFRLSGGADVMVNELTLGFAHLEVPAILDESVGHIRQTYERLRKQPWIPMHERLPTKPEQG